MPNTPTPQAPGEVAGKVALITGAGSGIGRATALLFATEGAQIVVCDLDPEGGQATVRAIEQAGAQALFVQADVAQAADCARAVQQTLRHFARLDVLFNNAGITCRANVVDTSEADWDAVMAVNVKSIFLMSRQAVPVMAEQGGGSIINAGSGWGLVGGRDAVSYCAAKGAVVNMTRAMALDHGPQRIRVNSVCPGDTDTAMLRDEARQLGLPETALVLAGNSRPLMRVGRAEEIAQVVLFLASDRSSFVTGSAYVVDGGGLAGSG
ncbi:SDR family NAD(P)-dependent oxidoreductase [Verminephrobacter eiseniae]|uniref:Short-chain dehydrogenase/reductase SDR n=1 Tax=Verminephrobacter eiseniae (strain EF01-2) TaxID=391735 RepID=A1WKP5_VEREI|nr:SDR family NAD(P)-dependent oxidoreductase [Verminephrobacter eiseniae]ABM58202.1 short-chain dehydrogenase/reductase SDR [Verminephrobacter eiseniae EF01-2]MCW5283798.1 SDR family oxidoreductase [Verminephrobacter eiseniae]MCW5301507.1 SDR family oxidoreductase [Verminephrobacter eiseniae]MCW8180617.1 SDR family oxidoreductase [Verminephrobacter eiseniae]MCW8191343.1 SDR family oxidoreductase [Verminephrobacter eiseniae]